MNKGDVTSRAKKRQRQSNLEDKTANSLLAARIRENHSWFMVILEARKHCLGSKNMMEAGLLEAAMLHRRTMRELLWTARKRIITDEKWREWLKGQCLMSEDVANHYMKIAV